MIAPGWDDPIFERGWLQPPETLRRMVAWAGVLARQDPSIITTLLKPYGLQTRDAARALWNAHRTGAPLPYLLERAHEFNTLSLHWKAALDLPKPSKPTVGKATDRLGEKARRETAKREEREARRQLKAKAPPSPIAPLWEGW